MSCNTLLGYLSHRSGRQVDLDQIWEKQSLSEALVKLVREWSHQIRDTIVETASGRNVTEWCKKEECWKAIRSMSLALPDDLPVEITGTESGGGTRGAPQGLSPADLDAMHLCQELSAQDWIAISEWGNATGELKSWQIGIAGTLGTYAAQDWSRSPSVKQARRGAEIIKHAKEEGGFLSGKIQ